MATRAGGQLTRWSAIAGLRSDFSRLGAHALYHLRSGASDGWRGNRCFFGRPHQLVGDVRGREISFSVRYQLDDAASSAEGVIWRR